MGKKRTLHSLLIAVFLLYSTAPFIGYAETTDSSENLSSEEQTEVAQEVTEEEEIKKEEAADTETVSSQGNLLEAQESEEKVQSGETEEETGTTDTEDETNREKEKHEAPAVEENIEKEVDKHSLPEENAEADSSSSNDEGTEKSPPAENNHTADDQAVAERESAFKASRAGLIDIGLLKNVHLKASYTGGEAGKKQITLVYSGESIGLEIATSTYITFNLPPEVMEQIETVSASYVDRVLGIIPVEREAEVKIDRNKNHIYWEFTSLLELDIGTLHTFTLTVELKELPVMKDGEYDFYAISSSEAFIQVSLLSNKEAKKATIQAPRYLEAPVLDKAYTTETSVSGKGEPDKTVKLTVGDIDYQGTVDEEGKFSIENLPPLETGTTIEAVLEDEEWGNKSEPATTLVQPMLAFKEVPETLSFEKTAIRPVNKTIPKAQPFSIEIMGKKGKEFDLYARIDTPLTSDQKNHRLPADALVFGNTESPQKPLEPKHSIKVFTGQLDEQGGKNITWGKDEGLLLDVYTGNVYAETYETTINWTLVDGPN